jgi:hypothetical protein
MKQCAWYKRYCILCSIREKLLAISNMGRYSSVGMWEYRIRNRQELLKRHYNSLKFCWQKSI